MMAVIPAVLFGGFAMAGSFTESETTAQTADAMLATTTLTETLDLSGATSTPNAQMSEHFTIELEDSLVIADSVEVSSP